MQVSVTIVVNCYSHKRFFRRALESAVRQTVKCKIVLFDNGSPVDYQEEIEDAAREFSLKIVLRPGYEASLSAG